jgi:peroxisomal enoyl-CoA hydratase 2
MENLYYCAAKKISKTGYFMQANEVDAGFNKRDAIIYALGIGCGTPRFIYEHDERFRAFPTLAFALTLKGSSMDVHEFPPSFYPLSSIPVNGPVLDGERLLELTRPLGASEDLVMATREIGNFKSGSGAVAQTETILRSRKDNSVVATMTSNAFYVGTTDHPNRGTCRKFVRPVPLARSPDQISEYQTFPWQAALYRLSGDYNPLHIDSSIAEAFGYKQPILHGLCTLGIATRLVVQWFGDASRVHRVGCRFSKPVFPGDLLQVEMWKTDQDSVSFRVLEKASRRVVIDQAFIDFFPTEVSKL